MDGIVEDLSHVTAWEKIVCVWNSGHCPPTQAQKYP